jgi:hypothetical protein
MRILFVTLFVATLADAARAQGLGYAIAGPAGTSGFVNTNTTFHAAGGGEAVVADRAGVGGEFGFFNRLIVGSGNAVLRFGTAFVTGGYSRMGIGDGEGAFSAINFGGGGHLWGSGHAGLRVEFRDHVRRDDRGNTHYWSIRAGIAFR